jgi:hypothetical protein
MEITINLTKDQSLVLFEFLSRLNVQYDSPIFEDQAEQVALWEVEGQLQKVLVEPFMPDYIEILAKARERLRQID